MGIDLELVIGVGNVFGIWVSEGIGRGGDSGERIG